MLRTTLKNLAAHKLRLLTTSIAVLLGVAFMAGTLVLTDTVGKTFDDLFADVNEGTDAYIRGETTLTTGEGEEQRSRLDASLVATITGVEGVAAAEGGVEGYAQIVGSDGDAIGNPAMGAPTLGAAWQQDDGLNAFDLAEGRSPQATAAGTPYEVVIDRGSADKGALAVGDTTQVLTAAGPQAATIVGVAAFGEADSPGGAGYTFFTPEAAQALVAEPGQIDSISVVAEDGMSPGQLVERISEVVPEGTEVLTGAEITAENQAEMQAGLGFFNTFLLTFAVIALFVGSFIIYNTFSILVAQRTKDMALLRALGASRRQVKRSVLIEAVFVGLVASVLGLFAGIGVAAGLKELLALIGFDIPTGALVVTTKTMVVSLIAGLGVSVVSATFPARRAAKVPPIAAMRSVAQDASGGSRKRMIAGVAITALGGLAMGAGLSGAGFVVVGLGVMLVFIGISVLGPVIARAASWLLGAPLPRLRGMSGTLARENAMRNPKRTSTTASALMIGVALVTLITVMATSVKASISETMDSSFTGDVVVDSGSYDFGGLSPQLASDVAALPEVEVATGIRVSYATFDGATEAVLGTDPAAFDTIFDLGEVDGSLQDMGADQIALSEDKAEALGVEVGDTLPTEFAETGEQQLTVAAVYEEADAAGPVLLSLTTYEANVADQFDSRIYVAAADGVSEADAQAAVETLAGAYPQASVLTADEFSANQGAQIDQMLNLVYALLALAIVIALIGIANTLALSIFERTRELGLLRAVGMTRGQLRAAVRWEAVIIALLGTGLGLAVGMLFGWAVVEALASEGITTFAVPVTQIGIIVVLAALAGVAAAILPARRAARMDVLKAVSAD